MGEHGAPIAGWKAKARKALAFVMANRRVIATAVIMALPLVSRYWPEFPADQVVSLVRVFLGA